MIDKETYMTECEDNILKQNITTQVDKLLENLQDESKFRRKSDKINISIMKEGDEYADE